jgi:hypothetical protein
MAVQKCSVPFVYDVAEDDAGIGRRDCNTLALIGVESTDDIPLIVA